MNLKRELRELREDIKVKGDTYEELDNYLKNTTEKEIKKKIFNFVNQCKELRTRINNEMENTKRAEDSLRMVKQIEEKLQQQSLTLTNMKKESEKLVLLIRKKDIDIKRINGRVGRLEANHKKLPFESIKFDKNKAMLADAKKELKLVKSQIKDMKTEKNNKETEMYQNKVEELIKQQKELEEKIEGKEQEINNFKETHKSVVNTNENMLEEMRIQIKKCNITLYT